MQDNRALFDIYLGFLQKVVAARGGDPAGVSQEYVWPEAAGGAPMAAQSLSPLLTGGATAPPWAHGNAPSGVVAVPAGLTPPSRH